MLSRGLESEYGWSCNIHSFLGRSDHNLSTSIYLDNDIRQRRRLISLLQHLEDEVFRNHLVELYLGQSVNDKAGNLLDVLVHRIELFGSIKNCKGFCVPLIL